MKYLHFLNNRIVIAVWLVALAVFVVAGVPIAPFHGDEAMQIWMSHDYATAFIYGEPVRLMSDGPFDIDAEAQLRILNGSINRYAIGLSWHLAGYTNGDLPTAPGWDWGLDYDTNAATNHRSPDALLHISRLSSALFLALSVWAMFGIGWQMGGPLVAYLASGLYALNPIILLNGRRAMMEGSMLLFGLLAIFVAVTIARKRAQGGRGLWGWWLALILASALAITSKHTGVIFAGGAFGWILLSELIGRRWRDLPVMLVKLAVSGVLALALFVVLSPALWYDPAARFQDLLKVRQELIDIQVTAHTSGAMPLAQRLEYIITQPFLTPAQHFEVAAWAEYTTITNEITRYMNSPLSGWQFGPIVGLLLTLLVPVGLIAVVRREAAVRAGVLVWLAGTLVMLLLNPLPWQRYYLPLIPIYTLLSSVGLRALTGLIVERPEQHPTKEPLVSEGVQPQTGR